MKDNLKNRRAAFISKLRHNKLKGERTVAFTVKREERASLNTRIGNYCDRNMEESIRNWVEAK